MAFKLLSGVSVPDDWSPYVLEGNTEFEVFHRPIWDTQTIATNQSAAVNWFVTAQATLDLGNEVFPLKNSYLCAAIGIYFKDSIGADNLPVSGTAYAGRGNDHVLITNTGVLSITIGGKSYGDWPMFKLIPGAGVWGLVAAGGTPTAIDYTQMGPPDPRAMFKLAIPLVMPMNTKIVMSSTWPGGALSLSATSKACLILDGKEARGH